MEHSDKLETETEFNKGVVHVFQTTQNLVISHCCFAEDGIEMYQEL